MSYTAKDYAYQLDELLPRGPIWKRRQGTLLDAFIFALSNELARVSNKAEGILDEADPRTSIELLEEWFNDWGIPSACLTALADPNQEQKRRELITKIISSRSLTAEFFKEVAESIGYECEIVTYSAFTVADTVDKALYGTEWNTSYSMGIRVKSQSPTRLFTTNWTVDQPLAVWGDSLFECLMRELIPAHVVAIFEYE